MRGIVALGTVVLALQLACGGVNPAAPAFPGPRQEVDSTPAVVEPLPTRDDVALHPGDVIAFAGQDAQTLVLVYTDWKCPHCEASWSTVQELAMQHPDLQVRYRSFPLSGPCNDSLPLNDAERCTLAKAALCAAQEGAFVSFATAAYAHPEVVLSQTAWSGLAMTDCLQDAAMDGVVQDHIALGRQLEIQGTPSFFVRNDGQWFGPLHAGQLQSAIQR